MRAAVDLAAALGHEKKPLKNLIEFPFNNYRIPEMWRVLFFLVFFFVSCFTIFEFFSPIQNLISTSPSNNESCGRSLFSPEYEKPHKLYPKYGSLSKLDKTLLSVAHTKEKSVLFVSLLVIHRSPP